MTNALPVTPDLYRDWWWLRYHAEWWEETGSRLNWRPIDTYEPEEDEAMAIASPVLLRDGDRWIYGSLVTNEWFRFSEGASWPIEYFKPTHWAEPSLDDAIMLGQD